VRCSTVGATAFALWSVSLGGCRKAYVPPLQADGGGCSERALSAVLTFHNDNARTGQYLTESCLTPNSVRTPGFGLLFVLATDGKVDAQPLFMPSVLIPGKDVHDVLFVATEHDTVYAFDADNNVGPNADPLWQTSLLGPNESPSDPRHCDSITPEIGVAGTGVIDPSTNTLYVVAMSKSDTAYVQRLHALDITTGGERPGSPVVIQATYPGTGLSSDGVNDIFDPSLYKQRAGLLLANGQVYTAWGSHCDQGNYSGFVIAYDAASLQQSAVIDLVPNGWAGSIWMTGGLAADTAGNVFAVTGNGSFETALDDAGFPSAGDYGDTFVRLSAADGGLAVADYFAPSDTVDLSTYDIELGSGGIMLLPDSAGSAAHRHLMVGAGKDTNIYLLDRDLMGRFNPARNDIVQQLDGALDGGVWAVPAYYNGAIYYSDVDQPLKRFALDAGLLSLTPTSQTAISFAYPGSFPSVSADGRASPDAILWAVESNVDLPDAVLHAYLAADVSQELYNSEQAPDGIDEFGAGNKFVTPTVADGKVYVATPSGVGVFGLR